MAYAYHKHISTLDGLTIRALSRLNENLYKIIKRNVSLADYYNIEKQKETNQIEELTCSY